MVYLDADKQTYADLNVTGNVYGEQALCSLFLKAETKKGKSLMLDWIMHPLSDWEEICKRQEAIAWDFLPELPLNEEELDFIEYYLEYREQIREQIYYFHVRRLLIVLYDMTRTGMWFPEE